MAWSGQRMKRLSGIDAPFIDDARPWIRYPARAAFAVACTAAGLAVVAALEPALSRPYYFPAFAAIVLAAVVAGARAGVLTTVLFALGYAYWFLSPRRALAVRDPREATALVAYTLTGWFVAAVGGALRRAYAELRTQHVLLDRAVGQREDLLHAMTHDVRTPLSSIRMAAGLVARSADPEAVRRARVIQASVDAIDSMLNDLVKVVALESGQVVLARGPVRLDALLGAFPERLAGTLPVDRLRLAIPGDLPPVHADARRLERVLVNLVSNALKYSEGPVAIGAAAEGGEVVVSVRDEGPGISPEDQARLFHKFFRAAGARAKPGLGLGLYISRLIVEAHGGRIGVVSAPGQGTTFRVALPAEPPPVPAGASAAGR
jgi:signal transduction histidine kinase